MALTPQDIARIANLARLELNPYESERMLTQINGFFDIVEKMRAVDTSGVEPALNLNLSGDVTWVGGWGINVRSGKAQGSTTASRKLIPVTDDYLAAYKRGWNMWGVKMYRDHRGRRGERCASAARGAGCARTRDQHRSGAHPRRGRRSYAGDRHRSAERGSPPGLRQDPHGSRPARRAACTRH